MKSVGYGCGVKMASLLPENGVIYETAQVAPSPSKDYCQVIVTADEVDILAQPNFVRFVLISARE